MSIFESVLGFIGNERTNAANADIAASNNAWNAEQYAKRYQVQVKDLEAAGLNPAMAYSQNPGSAPTAQSYQATDSIAAGLNNYRQSSINSAQVANIQADTQNKEAQADLIAAQAANLRSSAAHTQADIHRVNADTERIKTTLPQIQEDTKRLRYLQANLAESSALMAQQGQSEVVRRKHLESMIANLVRDGVIKDADIQAIEKTGGLGRIAREMKPVSDIADTWLPTVNPFKKKGK
jgi:hypothetical protein